MWTTNTNRAMDTIPGLTLRRRGMGYYGLANKFWSEFVKASIFWILTAFLVSNMALAKEKPEDPLKKLECADGEIPITQDGTWTCFDLASLSSTDRIQVNLSGDQTIGGAPRFIGAGTISNSFDDTAFVVPRSGVITDLVVSSAQNIAAGVPQSDPFYGFVVKIPYDADNAYPDTYGTPALTSALGGVDFVVLTAAVVGSVAAGVDLCGEEFPLGPGVPVGATISLFAIALGDAHLGQCETGNLPVSAGDLVSVMIVPDSGSFIPKATIIIETD